MKKILALGLGLSLIMSLGTANASDVAQRVIRIFSLIMEIFVATADSFSSTSV